MKRYASLLAAGTLALTACSDLPTTTNTGNPPDQQFNTQEGTAEFVPGQIIVRFVPGAARSEIAEAHRARKKDDMLLDRTELLEVPIGQELVIAAELSKHPNVEFAEADFIMRLGPCEVAVNCLLPDGGFFNLKWDLYNPGSFVDPSSLRGGVITTGKPDADIDWAELYDRLGPAYAGSAVIGVLDGGIRASHALFGAKIIGGKRFLSDSTTAGKTNVTDDTGHGSHVAGIAAGRWNAALAGVAYGANIKLLIAKVCNSSGSCPNSGITNAIVWAVDNGANVLNLSLGTFGGLPDGVGSTAQRAALQYALSRNVLSVCSTGNDDNKPGNGYVGGIGYPARFPECMAVGATNWSDAKATYSNYGPQIAVSAPGGDGERVPYSLIMSASRNGDNLYTWNAGTSMAAPQVSGLAAMLYASGYTSAAAVRQRIIETADDIDAPGWDSRTGAGRINAYRAFTGLEPNAPPVPVIGGPYAGSEGSPIVFDGSASHDPNGKPVVVSWAFGDGNTAVAATWSHTYADNGRYNVLMTVVDAANNARGVNSVVDVANVAPSVTASLNTNAILSGQSVTLAGGFSDPGRADAPWTASINWNVGTTTWQVHNQIDAISASRRYCAVGPHTVQLSVTDKDGDAGTSTAGVLVVSANPVSIMLPSAVNNNSLNQGTLPVSVLGSVDFNVSNVDIASVLLGTGTPVSTRMNGTWMSVIDDVNGDGYDDLVLHFARASLLQAGDLVAGVVQLRLRAVLNDACTAIAGAAPIKVVP